MIWLYGEPKIGKTTFAAQFPGAWFIATERGQDWVTIREPTYIESWPQFLALCAGIDSERPKTFGDGSPIQTLVIDTFDLLFRMCYDHVCRAMGVTDPGEIPHGGGWGRLDKEFTRVMNKVARWPYGLVCISHSRQKEFKTRGRKTDRMEPNVGAAATRWANQAADLIGYAHMEEISVKDAKGAITGEIVEQRVLQVHPSASAVAGGRFSRFLPQTMALEYAPLRDAITEAFAPEPTPSSEE